MFAFKVSPLYSIRSRPQLDALESKRMAEMRSRLEAGSGCGVLGAEVTFVGSTYGN